MVFQFLLSMLLALHTFPCFLSPFVWNSEKSPSSQILEFTEPSAGSAAPSSPGLLPACALQGAQQGCSEAGLPGNAAGIPEQEHLMISKVFSSLGNPGILCWCTGTRSPGKGEQEFHIELGRTHSSVRTKNSS